MSASLKDATAKSRKFPNWTIPRFFPSAGNVLAKDGRSVQLLVLHALPGVIEAGDPPVLLTELLEVSVTLPVASAEVLSVELLELSEVSVLFAAAEISDVAGSGEVSDVPLAAEVSEGIAALEVSDAETLGPPSGVVVVFDGR